MGKRTQNSVVILMIQKLKLFGLSFCIIVCSGAHSQINTNLIKNPSFENYYFCPLSFDDLNKCKNWFDPAIYSSPDYFNACATGTSGVNVPNSGGGFQTARTGSAFAGFSPFIKENYSKEYVGCQVSSQLKLNKLYCVTYHVNLAEISRYAIRSLGFNFTKDSIKTSVPPQPPYEFNINPSFEVLNGSVFADTLNWMKVQGIYLSNGTENFLTIGNFRDTINTFKQQLKPNLPTPPYINFAYYYIDDVSVVEINSAKAYSVKSITVCANTTLTLGADSTEEATYQWQPSTGLSCTNCPNPVVTVTSTQKYVLSKQQCSATTKDSVTITIYTPTLTANAGPFKNICLNDTIKLGVNDTTAYTTYTWQPANGLSCANCPQPVTMPLTTTTYTLTKKECAFNTKDTVTILVETCEVIIPDIFTPNNDNVNDEWKIKLPNGFKLTTVAVYNRWGTLVYNIDDEVLNSANSKIKIVRWDGRTTSGLECSEGVYFYVIHYTDKNAILHKQKGNLTLMR